MNSIKTAWEQQKSNWKTVKKTAKEIMFDVSYTDTKAFRDVFKKVAGMSPVDYNDIPVGQE